MVEMRTCSQNTNYAVDKFGNVYSLCHEQKSRSGNIVRRERVKLLKGSIDKYGYRTIRIVVQNKKKHIKVHRLVASAFLKNPHNKKEVNHIDGNKLNNNVENLEWSTRKENNEHAIKTGLLKFKSGNHHPLTRVFSWDFVTIYLMIKHCGYSRKQIAKNNNVSRQTIDKVYNIVEKEISLIEASYENSLVAN